jgi:acetyltransferase-like isoleucine patch superfamily enzyme
MVKEKIGKKTFLGDLYEVDSPVRKLSRLKIVFDELLVPFYNFSRRAQWYSKFPDAEVYFVNTPPRRFNVTIGRGSVGDCLYLAGVNGDRLKIGKKCRLGKNTTFITSARSHKFGSPLEDNIELGNFIELGDNVWTGLNVTIMPNVKIGDGAVIGACSVVTHDVAPYTIVVGIPAKKIKSFPKPK